MRYFAVRSDPPAAEADKQWIARLLQIGQVCSLCANLSPGVKIGMAVLQKRPGHYPMTNLGPAPRIWIVQDDVLTALDSPEGYESGPIFLATKEVLDSFHFLIAEKLLVRGGAESNLMGACSHCGAIKYWPQRGPDEYVLRKYLSEEKPIYDLWVGGLALREDVYDRVAAKNFPGLNFYELPIRDEPEDGLPADLKPYLTPEEQAAMGDVLWRDYEASQRRAAAAKKGLEKAMEPYRRAEKAATMEEYYRIIYGEDSPQLGRVRERGEAHLPPPGRRK